MCHRDTEIAHECQLETSTDFANFEGTLDEIRLWSVARTGAEIASAKDLELTGSEAGLVVYLKANEGTGERLADASGHLNDALIRPVAPGIVAGIVLASRGPRAGGPTASAPSWSS